MTQRVPPCEESHSQPLALHPRERSWVRQASVSADQTVRSFQWGKEGLTTKDWTPTAQGEGEGRSSKLNDLCRKEVGLLYLGRKSCQTMIRTKKYLQQRVLLPRNVWKPLPVLSAQTALGVTRKRLTYLFNKTLIMQDAYFLLLGLWFSHTRGSFRSFRLAAESFCIRYRTPRTSSIVGDCWLCCLVRMDASCALWITRIWREIYHSFLKKQNYNCYLIKSECYSSFMFNLN